MPFTGPWLSAGADAERSDIWVSHLDANLVSATGVSLRGYGHLRKGTPLQDAHAVGLLPDSPILAALVADGSGRSPHSHWLSEAVVRGGWRLLAAELAGQTVLPANPQTLAANLRTFALEEGRALCTRLNLVGEGINASTLTGAEVAAFMACTLHLVLVHTTSLAYTWLDVAGDGSAYLRGRKGKLHVIHQGSDDQGQCTFSPPLPRFEGEALIKSGELRPGEMLVLVTDGIGEALLDGTTAEAVSFSSRLQTRPTVFNAASVVSSLGLADNDDKTLVLITT